jgi:hypothetical protein
MSMKRLEQHFPSTAVFQRTDLSGCLARLREREPFIAKLHGSRSAVETAVFTSEDYEQLKADTTYIECLRNVFTNSTVVFLGYSVSDQYVLDILSDSARQLSLFGAGPHFVVSSEFSGRPPLHRISYSLKRFPDHRSALTVLEIIRQVQSKIVTTNCSVSAHVESDSKRVTSSLKEAAYYISDFMPPGTWTTSTTAEFQPQEDIQNEVTVGLGFTRDEMPFTSSTAGHDLTVGLICFDRVYFPLSAVGKVHHALGSEFFWQLVQSDVIRFVHLQNEPAILLRKEGLLGDIGIMRVASENPREPLPPGFHIRRQLTPMLGKEDIAEKLFSDLEQRTVVFDETSRVDLAGSVRAAVMMPEVARLLGIGEAIVPTNVPRWLRFPYLRLAHLVHTGAVCDWLGIRAAKIPFGGAILTSAAFGLQSPEERAASYASYVLSGRFDADLGTALLRSPGLLPKILRFRESSEGRAFRSEVRDQLFASEAAEFTASVDAALRRNIPLSVLQKARDKFSSLLTESLALTAVPAVWTDSRITDDVTRLWRLKSRLELLALAKERKVLKSDPCLCGSGDKLQLCCFAPLRD